MSNNEEPQITRKSRIFPTDTTSHRDIKKTPKVFKTFGVFLKKDPTFAA